MPFRHTWSRWIGGLRISYGLIWAAFWGWILLNSSKANVQSDLRGMGLAIVPFVGAPVLLIVAGYAMNSVRIARPDAQSLKSAAVVALALKAAIAGYWAVGLILASGSFSNLLHSLGWRAVAFEVIPSGIWAVVLATTSIPSDDVRTPTANSQD